MESTIRNLTEEELVTRLSSQDEEIVRLKNDLAAAQSTLSQVMQQFTQVMDAMQQKGTAPPGRKVLRTYRKAGGGRKKSELAREAERVLQSEAAQQTVKTQKPEKTQKTEKKPQKTHRKARRVDQDYPRGSHNFTDLSGRRFGMLTAIRPTEERSYKGSVMWLCRCDCGREVVYAQDGLVFGSYKSCGCNRYSGVKAALEKLTFVDGTCIEWLEKRETRADNTSGHTGVCRTKRGKWYALIGMQGDRYHLGVYDTFEEAVRARECAKKILHDAFTQQYHSWQAKAAEDPVWAEKNPFHVSRYGHEELRQMVRRMIYISGDDSQLM